MATLGVKYMIAGQSKIGKTTLTKGLEDAYVINGDFEKAYPLLKPHTTVYPKGFLEDKNTKGALEFNGMDKFIKELKGKLVAYAKVHKKYPKTVVFDTYTSIISRLNEYNNKFVPNNYGSRAVQTAQDIDSLNNFIEKVLIHAGIDVVVIAHTVYDEAQDVYTVPTEGSKRLHNKGGLIGMFDYVSFLTQEDGTRIIYHNDVTKPCRNLLEGVPEVQTADEFNIQDMLDNIKKHQQKIKENEDKYLV